jgi:hypothetical protein
MIISLPLVNQRLFGVQFLLLFMTWFEKLFVDVTAYLSSFILKVMDIESARCRNYAAAVIKSILITFDGNWLALFSDATEHLFL